MIAVTILRIILCFLKASNKNFKLNTYIKQAVGQITFGNYTVTNCNFFVITKHCDNGLCVHFLTQV